MALMFLAARPARGLRLHGACRDRRRPDDGRLGLPGRAVLPIVVGFGCNVPAVSATRILPNSRQPGARPALLVPLTSCSARLTVYMLLASTLFPTHAGTVVFAMYLVSIAARRRLVGLGLRATLSRDGGAEPLVIDLPPYQRPTAAGYGLSVPPGCGYRFLRDGSRGDHRRHRRRRVAAAVGPCGAGYVRPRDGLEEACTPSCRRAASPLLSPAGFGRWEAVGRPARRVRRQGGRGRRRGAQTYAARRAGFVQEPVPLGTAAPTFSRRSGGPHRGSGRGVHGVPARVHAVPRDARGPAPRARHEVDRLRRRLQLVHRLDCSRCWSSRSGGVLVERVVALPSRRLGPLTAVLRGLRAPGRTRRRGRHPLRPAARHGARLRRPPRADGPAGRRAARHRLPHQRVRLVRVRHRRPGGAVRVTCRRPPGGPMLSHGLRCAAAERSTARRRSAVPPSWPAPR